MTGKFTINAVDPSGVPWEVCMTDHADSAALVADALGQCWHSSKKLFWVTLTDDPERGEVDPHEV